MSVTAFVFSEFARVFSCVVITSLKLSIYHPRRAFHVATAAPFALPLNKSDIGEV